MVRKRITGAIAPSAKTDSTTAAINTCPDWALYRIRGYSHAGHVQNIMMAHTAPLWSEFGEFGEAA
jgi:hypothetical protein